MSKACHFSGQPFLGSTDIEPFWVFSFFQLLWQWNGAAHQFDRCWPTLAAQDMGLRQIFRVVFEDDMSECQPLVEALSLAFDSKHACFLIGNEPQVYQVRKTWCPYHPHTDCWWKQLEAFHWVLDGLSNPDKKKFLMFVTGIEVRSLSG